MMSLTMRKGYFEVIQARYLKSSREEKTGILDEYCKNTGQNRKYVIRKLSVKSKKTALVFRKKRKPTYGSNVILALIAIWKILDFPCGQRLKPVIPEMIEVLTRFGELKISELVALQLKTMGSATIDRRLKREREHLVRRRFVTTKPGYLLKRQIPIKLTQWDTHKVGYCEIDLVAHCGDRALGEFIHTLDLVEIATGWSEQMAVMGKGERNVFAALKKLRERTPFTWLGIDSDNGGEFINHQLFRYCQQEGIEFTRSRPLKKNDNAYVEQKNWTHVRKVIGYDRMETGTDQQRLNELYQEELRMYQNFFQPVLKLAEKKRVGSKIIKRREVAKTPYQRILESDAVIIEVKDQLKATYATLNPAELKRNIEKKLKKIHQRKELIKQPA